jgi:X-X-X-Leu-X-X-Gly heptad repeat protein
LPVAGIEFAGDERFTILARVGEGGMGVVYKALDKERGGVVALKTLHALGAAAVFRLKHEFRSLADLSHPNLIALHELVQSGGHWFMTMEYVEGTHFLAWVRPGGALAYSQTMTSTSLSAIGDPAPARRDEPHGVDGAMLDVGRLRDGFAQLASGVAALHAAGKLHRDIKPSNVLVTTAGRVVLLDFGLVTELAPGRVGLDEMAGTAGYMAPEQSFGGPLGAASDWYAAGVML